MEWRCYETRVMYGLKKVVSLNIPYDISYTDDRQGVFFVCASYNKNGTINNYGVYFQDNDHVKHGGENFVLYIRKCSSMSEGRRIAEQFYNDVKDGNCPKYIGTQYIPEETHLSGPFIN